MIVGEFVINGNVLRKRTTERFRSDQEPAAIFKLNIAGEKHVKYTFARFLVLIPRYH